MTITVIYRNLRKGLFDHILIITRTNTSKMLQHNNEKYNTLIWETVSFREIK